MQEPRELATKDEWPPNAIHHALKQYLLRLCLFYIQHMLQVPVRHVLMFDSE